MTGELPDMVTFMEATHTRKDSTFVDKKAEAIILKCREREQEMLTQLSQESQDPENVILTQTQKKIYTMR